MYIWHVQFFHNMTQILRILTLKLDGYVMFLNSSILVIMIERWIKTSFFMIIIFPLLFVQNSFLTIISIRIIYFYSKWYINTLIMGIISFLWKLFQPVEKKFACLEKAFPRYHNSAVLRHKGKLNFWIKRKILYHIYQYLCPTLAENTFPLLYFWQFL